MIKWYTAGDLSAGYDLSEYGIKYWVRTGKLEYMRLSWVSEWGAERSINLIPDLELHKLAKYKTGIPQFKARHQPSEILRAYSLAARGRREWRVGPSYAPQETRSEYYEYMQSQQWEDVRQEALERDGYQCRMCGTAKNLQVHHVSYEHLGMADELDDVITLCRECHKTIHAKDIKEKAR